MNKNLRRSVVALATAFACLGIMASPASATPHSAVITGGTITAVSTGTTTFTGTLGGTVGVGCGSTLVVDVDHTAQTGNITTFASVGHFVLNGNHYVATITRTASTTGSVTTTGTVTNLGVSLNVVIRAAANNSSTNEDCATTGTTLCTLRTTLVFGGTHSHTGAGSISTSDTASLNSNTGAITLGIGTCQVPFSTFSGGTASVSGLTAHITT